MTKESRKLYEEVKKWNWAAIDKFVKSRGDINASLVSTGPEAGYTALHFAVMAKKEQHAERLIQKYATNVNSVAKDGATPLHIAYLRGDLCMSENLLLYGADINAKFNKQVYEKYNVNNDMVWTDDFGGTMTLIAFAVLNKRYNEMTEDFILCEPNIGIRDTHNRTLLMRAIKNNDLASAWNLADDMAGIPELLNARDNDGWHAINYLMLKYEMRQSGNSLEDEVCKSLEKLRNFKGQSDNFVDHLIKLGADINATVNGDPDTLLLNKAALTRCFEILSILLKFDVPLSVEAKPLRYITLPVNWEENIRQKNDCIGCIIEYYTLRRALRVFVPEEEVDLMDQMISADSTYEEIVEEFEEDFIDYRLKKLQICYGYKSISCFDVAVKVFDAKSFKQLVKDDEFVDVFQTLHYEQKDMLECVDKYNLHEVISDKIQEAYIRKELMEEIQNIPKLRVFIPLPFEIILDILNYLNNEDLQNFVRAI